jgi:hypothetical protein
MLLTLAALVCLAWFGFCRQAAAADPAQWTVDVAHTDADPKIDGTLDDPEWKKASHVDLTWDYQFRRPASEKTDAYLMVDNKFVYVAIVAQQSEPITATLHTNDVTLAPDDLVRVYFWPGGERGFEYGFVSTPIGTRNEFSTENSAFAPKWTAVGKRTPTGYVITMRIPLNVMRGDGRSTWRLQVERVVHVTNQDYEWAHDPSQNGVDNSLFVGYLKGMNVARASTRTKPRIGLYTLGQIGSPSAGGDTSHMGADIALPITDTSSFFSTLHPDYSNVDRDQQSISPTAFTRFFTEVRPFFTQGLNFYNNFNCNDCIDVPFLYTPAIPTPRDGYAVEGVQGLAQFAGFSSVGTGRNDNAQTLSWSTPDRHYSLLALRFGTNCAYCPSLSSTSSPNVNDETSIVQAVVGNRHNSSFYVTAGGNRGTNVTSPELGHYREYGINLYTQKWGIFPAYHDVGPQYAPVDGFVQINDVRGLTNYMYREFDNAPTSFIRSYNVSQDYGSFRNSAGKSDFGYAVSALTITTKTLYQLAMSSGYQHLLLPSGDDVQISQNGASLTYGNTTSAPTSVSYNIGRFGPGYLRTTTRLTTLRLGPRGTLTLEGDNTNQTIDTGFKEVQWLERASIAYQASPDSSLAIGLRRIIGVSPLLSLPTSGVTALNKSNVSLAYHRYVGQNELYVVYGDPGNLSTLPAFIVKFVHYFGAEKGT